MKYIWLFAAIIISLGFAGCAIDLSSLTDIDTDQFLQQDTEFSFEEQAVQGTFGEVNFEYASGYAEEDYPEENMYFIVLYAVEPDTDMEPWEAGAYPMGEHKIMFSMPKAEGLYPLMVDINNLESSQTVTLVEDQGEDGPMNYVCHQGAIEITAIDETAGTIEGNLDARDSSGSSVNGAFTVPIAPVTQ